MIDARLRGAPRPPAAAELAGPAAEVAGAVRQDNSDVGLSVLGVSPQALRGNVVRALDCGRAEFILQLDPTAFPGTYALTSLALCGTADRCQALGWMPGADIPTTLPVHPEAMLTTAFVYTRLRAQGLESARWDCRRIKRDNPAQCLPRAAAPSAASSPSRS